MKPTTKIALCMASWALVVSTNVMAQAMELRAVMQDMGRSLQLVVDSISRENWEKAADAAARIVSHPQPSDSEKTRIITFFGPDMGRFKSLDSQTGEAAAELERHARAAQPQKVIESVAKVQTSCLACHQAFRERFLNQFYLPDRLNRRP